MNTRTQTLLSTLWIFVVLNLFARDLHELGRPGMLEQMMSGVVDGVTITPGLMLLGGIMIEIFLVMVVLSQVLKYQVNRCANMIVGLIAMVIVVMTNLSPDLDNIFFMIIEMVTLGAIIRIAWRWKIEAS
jgi:glucan phosphoethanolaminetransferase (alkaline phosphatase superfamily)